jgi:DNA-binding GntR family transcriptional regulator
MPDGRAERKSLPLSHTLQRNLADEIIDGTLLPGARLDEMSLARRFAVSRTPVREALHQLVASGLAEKAPHRGVLVARMTRERLAGMFETMAELEASCARMAALRMNPAERQALERLHDDSARLVRAGDLIAYESFNLAFHAAIYAGAHNEFLEQTTLGVRARLAPFRGVQFRVADRLARSFAEHATIVTAVVRGEGDRARECMLSHLSIVETAAEAYVIDGAGDPQATRHRA